MSSVGIIGGSDGPTAVFVSQKFNAIPFIIGICAVIAVAVVVIIASKKHKNKK